MTPKERDDSRRKKSRIRLNNTMGEDAFYQINKRLAHYLGFLETLVLQIFREWDNYIFGDGKNSMTNEKRIHHASQYGQKAIELSNDGYFYLDIQEYLIDLNISEDFFRKIIKKLEEMQFLSIQRCGMPCRNFYRVESYVIDEFLATEDDAIKVRKTRSCIRSKRIPLSVNSGINNPLSAESANTPQSLTGQDSTAVLSAVIKKEDNKKIIDKKIIDNNTGSNTNVLLPVGTTACAVRGRGSSETPCSAGAGIGWRSKSKGKTSSPEPHDSPDSLRKTESSFPENISRNSRYYGITIQPSYPPIVPDSIGGGSDSIGGVPQSRMNSGVEAPFQGGSIDYSIDSLDNNNTIVSSLSKHTIGNETKVSLPMETTACAVRGRGSSETPCSAGAGIGWRSKSKGKTSSPEPHDSPDSLRKTESSFPGNISSLAPDNIPVLTPIIDDSEHFQNSDVSDIIPEEKMDSSPIKPVLSTVSGDDNIPPVQVKNRDNFKIRNSYNGAESKEIIDHWNSTGLKFLDSKYKSSVTNYLTDIMNGTFFDDKPWLKSPSKAFGKHEIMAAIDNRAMAAIDVNYSPIDPVRKKAMRDLPMWLWLYNPSTRKSQFLNNLKPPKPSYRQPNLIEDEQPPFTAAIKAAYIKKILYGVEPVSSWSNHDENNFRRAGALLWEFVERNGKRIPFVYRHQYYRLAEALLDAILNDVNEDDRPSITTGWLCSDLTFNRRLPAYLGNIRMLL